jgi:hypothetical protein
MAARFFLCEALATRGRRTLTRALFLPCRVITPFGGPSAKFGEWRVLQLVTSRCRDRWNLLVCALDEIHDAFISLDLLLVLLNPRLSPSGLAGFDALG